jgi:hypothetical protein
VPILRTPPSHLDGIPINPACHFGLYFIHVSIVSSALQRSTWFPLSSCQLDVRWSKSSDNQ